VYAGDPAALRELELLSQSTQRRLAQLEAAVSARRASDAASAVALVRANDERDTMGRIRSALTALKQRENGRHDELARLAEERRTVLLMVEVLVLLLMLMAGAAAYHSLRGQVRERNALAEQLEQQALHDPLTALPNRRHFSDELARSMARAARRHEQRAVLFIDLDDFKDVNDRLGHPMGDELLRQVARRFAGIVRRSEFVARIGGDEFAVLLEGYSAEGARLLAERLIEAIEVPLLPGHPEQRISASIGIAVYPQDAIDPDGLLSKADAAMYDAKHAGKGAVRLIRDGHGKPAVAPGPQR
jgi:diguanylate cyclase (GGDEF)-like protein